MTIIDELLDDGVAAAEKAVPGVVAPWIDKALAALEAQIPNLPDGAQALAHRALDSLVAHKRVFGTLSQKGFVALATHLTLGQGEKAQQVYLGTNASFEERMAVLDADSEATRQEAADRNAAWQKVKSTTEDLLLGFGKFLVPVVLAL